MQDHAQNYLRILGQLAQEYQQKFAELEKLCQNAQPQVVLPQLKARAELTTDHFRGAQQFLLTLLDKNQTLENEDLFKAVTTACRCFDEMRILFNVLLDYTSNPAK
ncbi:MAG: hypothetical protein RBS57_04510 [Desulforhabdus sp.]|jgi:hypothetical protein|nr:hypothetical protein [Desulforhabdus sp.]